MKNDKRVELFFLLSSIITPSLVNINMGGVHLTLYRLMVPIITVLCMARNNGSLRIWSDTYKHLIITFAIWILHGFALMLIIEGINKEAIKELLGLVLGIMGIYCLVQLIGLSRQRFYQAVLILKILVIACIIVGFIEILTGQHLSGSFYNDQVFRESQIARYGVLNTHYATGFQYNINDFSAFLAFVAPLFFIHLSKKQRIIDWIGLIGIGVICARNRATLSILALGTCIIYFIFLQRKTLKRQYFALMLILVSVCVVIIGVRLNNKNISDRSFSLIADLQNHLLNYRLRQGSSYKRIALYIDSLKAVVNTNFIGIGPSNFANYFTVHPSVSGLVNPHNYWLEIMTEYGVGVFALFISLLIKIYKEARKIYKAAGNVEALTIMSMLIAYVIVGLEPSSFINYTFQWIPLALGVSLINIYNLKKEKISYE